MLVIRNSLLAWRCCSGGYLFATDHTVTSVLFTYLPDAGKLNWGRDRHVLVTLHQSSFDQIDTFQQEWQEKVDCEKQSITLDKTRQTKRHPTQAPVLPFHERFDRPNNAKFGLISEPNRVTPHANQNNNTSRSSTTKKDGHTIKRRKMPSTATIVPRTSTGIEPFKFNVRFDMKRT